MTQISITIDGIKVIGQTGMTILDASLKVGIEIPTLCHRPELSPDGSCRVCVVEVEGERTLVGACHTPIKDGMVIWTSTPRVRNSVKATLELLIAGHTGPCVTDPHARECELHQLASRMEMGAPRFRARRPRSYPVEDVSPYIRRDLSKCILCNRCIRACREIAGQNIFSKSYRSIHAKVTVDLDEVLNKEICRDCGICIEYCPTGALTAPTKVLEESHAAR